MEQLFNDNPYKTCTYIRHINRSFTDCLESRQYGARKETTILRRNGRLPTVDMVWHLTEVFSAKEIQSIRKRVFRYLKDNGLEAVATIELTIGDDNKPNNTVHFHILTDDQRSEKEHRELLETACWNCGLDKNKDYWISYKKLDDGNRYFEYFTKYDR